MPINIVKLGEWPKDTVSQAATPGKPGIAIIEDSSRDADSVARQLRAELRSKGVKDANIFVVLNLPGDDFQAARTILLHDCRLLCMVLVDMMDNDAIEWARRAGNPVDPKNRDMFPGIPLASELLGHKDRPIVLGLTGFPPERLKEFGKIPFESIYKPTFRLLVTPYIETLITHGVLQCQ